MCIPIMMTVFQHFPDDDLSMLPLPVLFTDEKLRFSQMG